MRVMVKTLLKINSPLFIVLLFPSYFLAFMAAGIFNQSGTLAIIGSTIGNAFCFLTFFIILESFVFAALNSTKEIDNKELAKSWFITGLLAAFVLVSLFMIGSIL